MLKSYSSSHYCLFFWLLVVLSLSCFFVEAVKSPESILFESKENMKSYYCTSYFYNLYYCASYYTSYYASAFYPVHRRFLQGGTGGGTNGTNSTNSTGGGGSRTPVVDECTSNTQCIKTGKSKCYTQNSGNTCVSCTKDTDCSHLTDTFYCGGGALGCLQCDEDSSHCQPENAFCSDGYCIPCYSDSECLEEYPDDESKQLCVEGNCGECRSIDDCGDPSAPECSAASCESCLSDLSCSTNPNFNLPYCNDESGSCVQCLQDSHCGTPALSTCVENECAECTEDSHCEGIDGDYYKCEAGTGCVECLSDVDCTLLEPVCFLGDCYSCDSQDSFADYDVCQTSGDYAILSSWKEPSRLVSPLLPESPIQVSLFPYIAVETVTQSLSDSEISPIIQMEFPYVCNETGKVFFKEKSANSRTEISAEVENHKILIFLPEISNVELSRGYKSEIYLELYSCELVPGFYDYSEISLVSGSSSSSWRWASEYTVFPQYIFEKNLTELDIALLEELSEIQPEQPDQSSKFTFIMQPAFSSSKILMFLDSSVSISSIYGISFKSGSSKSLVSAISWEYDTVANTLKGTFDEDAFELSAGKDYMISFYMEPEASLPSDTYLNFYLGMKYSSFTNEGARIKLFESTSWKFSNNYPKMSFSYQVPADLSSILNGFGLFDLFGSSATFNFIQFSFIFNKDIAAYQPLQVTFDLGEAEPVVPLGYIFTNIEDTEGESPGMKVGQRKLTLSNVSMVPFTLYYVNMKVIDQSFLWFLNSKGLLGFNRVDWLFKKWGKHRE